MKHSTKSFIALALITTVLPIANILIQSDRQSNAVAVTGNNILIYELNQKLSLTKSDTTAEKYRSQITELSNILQDLKNKESKLVLFFILNLSLVQLSTIVLLRGYFQAYSPLSNSPNKYCPLLRAKN